MGSKIQRLLKYKLYSLWTKADGYGFSTFCANIDRKKSI